MSNVSDLINTAVAAPSFSLSEQKTQAVASASDAKRVALGGLPDQQTFKNAAVARVTGAGLNSANPIESDLAQLSWPEIEQKYGADVATSLVAATQEYRGLGTGVRSNEQAAYDIASGVGAGLVGGFGGLASLGLTGVDAVGRKLGADTHMGVWAAEKVKKFDEAVKATQSPLLQNLHEANQEQSTLQVRDSTVQFDNHSIEDQLVRRCLNELGCSIEFVEEDHPSGFPIGKRRVFKRKELIKGSKSGFAIDELGQTREVSRIRGAEPMINHLQIQLFSDRREDAGFTHARAGSNVRDEARIENFSNERPDLSGCAAIEIG